MTAMPRAMLVCLVLLLAQTAAAAEPLVVATPPGESYERGQREAYFDPFAAATGIPLETVHYTDAVQALRAQADGPARWDVVDMRMAEHLRACEAGLLQRYTGAGLMPAPDGTPPGRDFLAGSFTPCGIAHNVYSTVIAFDEDFFRHGAQPHRIDHLFQPGRFPGKRALRKQPDALLEWALLSYGVPVDDLYELLSTERGLELAFRRLDRIRDQIVWWETPEEAVELLRREDVTFTMGTNAHFFHTGEIDDEPLQIIWDAQLYQLEVWGVPKHAPHPERARRFIGFATRTSSLAAQMRYSAYGPTRASAIRRVGSHATAGVDMRAHMPSHYLDREQRAIGKDQQWYARMREHLNERFQDWLAEGEPD